LRIAAIANFTVAVIASFPLVEPVVAATFNTADQITAVASDAITVIAGLDARLHHVVAARRNEATVEAGIGVDSIAVVAAFKAFGAAGDVGARNTVAATG
jgi:hypothetical protein